ncbi:sensor histidine kinase [Salinibacterium soli]|uniref:histidine kinase n=1 Tax=Antiquaquibacter soli TaxID=3064523 RepID=A0ABT9BRC6_9MICO|nr:HAMP domain-containing sensor histidine kinase [Protaetiibacter sp. WY-16]MDO7883194.1 HAMP domain-containing sensor histidine kinase [Protaetiibacter sp. WY-16]
MRWRTTLAATLVVGVALGLGSVAFSSIVERSLVDGVTETAERDADTVASLLEGSGSTMLPELDDALVQLVDGAGVIVESSADADDWALPAAASPKRADVDGALYLLVTRPVTVAGADFELRLALPLRDALDSADTVRRLLAIAVPVLLVLLAAVIWFVVGRALTPVERIRARVEAIGPGDLDARVDVPPTGDEIARLAATMNRMLDRLDSAAAAQRRFISDASHELRSPLASIRQHAEVARDHPDRLTGVELADVVLAEGIRLQDLVDQLLVLAWLAETGGALARKPVDLDDLALGEARRLRDTTALTIDSSAVAAARVEGDERLLARVLRNLADNAARHAHSRVALAVGARGREVEVVVEDDGTGIPESDRGRVFERFVRLDEARARDTGGSGLGLSIVAEIVRAHGGRVSVGESALGGARFVVTLPG